MQVQPCKICLPQEKNNYKDYKYMMKGNARNATDISIYYCNLTSKLVPLAMHRITIHRILFPLSV